MLMHIVCVCEGTGVYSIVTKAVHTIHCIDNGMPKCKVYSLNNNGSISLILLTVIIA